MSFDLHIHGASPEYLRYLLADSRDEISQLHDDLANFSLSSSAIDLINNRIDDLEGEIEAIAEELGKHDVL